MKITQKGIHFNGITIFIKLPEHNKQIPKKTLLLSHSYSINEFTEVYL